ncbi:MAG: helix-turn-helix domain-containing protein [Thermomicrobiales bacterium]
MPKRTTVVDHLELDELERRYRQAHDPVARSHLQIVWLLAQRKTRAEVAAVTGYSERWIGEIIRRYNQEGPEALGDRRHDNPGGQPILDADQQQRLWDALHGPAPDGGLWTGPKVAAWIEAETGHPGYPQLGWTYLVRFGARLKRCRPQHTQADPEEIAAFPKG